MLNHGRHVWTILYLAVLPSLAHAQYEVFDSNGVRIHYVEQGSGIPIVLVHGRNNTVQNWITPGY